MLLQLHQIYSIDATINSGNCIKDEKTKSPELCGNKVIQTMTSQNIADIECQSNEKKTQNDFD